MKILALDIATVTGWKTETASGTWNLKPNRGESEGMRVVRFKSKVREMVQMENIELISYERPAGAHKAAIMVESEMIGVLKWLCVELNIPLACYSAGQIKKFATGSGTANKEQMVKAAKEKYGYSGDSFDEADAIHLYHLTNTDINKAIPSQGKATTAPDLFHPHS